MGLPRTVEALTALVEEQQSEVAAAIERHGAGSREHREATMNLGILQRHLDAAVREEERRKESEALTPKQIVDRVYGR